MLAAPTASELSPTFGWEGGFPVEDECYLSPQYRCPATGTKDMILQETKSINAGQCDLPNLGQFWRVLKTSEKNRKEKSSFTFTKWLNLANHPFQDS